MLLFCFDLFIKNKKSTVNVKKFIIKKLNGAKLKEVVAPKTIKSTNSL